MVYTKLSISHGKYIKKIRGKTEDRNNETGIYPAFAWQTL